LRRFESPVLGGCGFRVSGRGRGIAQQRQADRTKQCDGDYFFHANESLSADEEAPGGI